MILRGNREIDIGIQWTPPHLENPFGFPLVLEGLDTHPGNPAHGAHVQLNLGSLSIKAIRRMGPREAFFGKAF